MPSFLKTFGDVFRPPDKVRASLIDAANNQHRLSHTPLSTQIFFSDYSTGSRSTIISGGSLESAYRTKLIRGIIHHFGGTPRIPVVILHCGNTDLACSEQPIGAAVAANYILRCDPLKGKGKAEISDLLADLGMSYLNLNLGMSLFWDVVQELMALNGIEVTLSTLSRFPCRNLSGEVEHLLNEGIITNSEAKSLLDRCRCIDPMSAATAAQLLRTLSTGFSSDDDGATCLGLDDVICNNGIASIDLVSDTKTVVKELCFLVLQRLMEAGHRFLVICDGLSVAEKNQYMCAMLKAPSPGVHFIFAGADVPAQLQEASGMLDKMISRSNAVVFSHTSDVGKKYWTTYFGSYRHEKLETTEGETNDPTKFFSTSKTKTIAVKEEMRDVLEEEALRELPENQAIVSLPWQHKRGIVTFPALAPR